MSRVFESSETDTPALLPIGGGGVTLTITSVAVLVGSTAVAETLKAGGGVGGGVAAGGGSLGVAGSGVGDGGGVLLVELDVVGVDGVVAGVDVDVPPVDGWGVVVAVDVLPEGGVVVDGADPVGEEGACEDLVGAVTFRVLVALLGVAGRRVAV